MAAFTAKNYPITKAPKRITLVGEKYTRPEPAQHIIEFPGGSIELSRTSDGNYWAHIAVNRNPAHDGGSLRDSMTGEIVGSRIDRVFPEGVSDFTDAETIEHVAVLIRPTRQERR